MSIRIRVVEGVTVALCAAETDTEEGDIYLDDAVHHALMDKFCHELLDYPRCPIAKKQALRDAKEELVKWLDEMGVNPPLTAGRMEG